MFPLTSDEADEIRSECTRRFASSPSLRAAMKCPATSDDRNPAYQAALTRFVYCELTRRAGLARRAGMHLTAAGTPRYFC